MGPTYLGFLSFRTVRYVNLFSLYITQSRYFVIVMEKGLKQGSSSDMPKRKANQSAQNYLVKNNQ
jgi:hypothetical protein